MVLEESRPEGSIESLTHDERKLEEDSLVKVNMDHRAVATFLAMAPDSIKTNEAYRVIRIDRGKIKGNDLYHIGPVNMSEGDKRDYRALRMTDAQFKQWLDEVDLAGEPPAEPRFENIVPLPEDALIFRTDC